MQFIFVLALALGRDLSDIINMPLSHFNAWRSYYKVFPFGDIRGDIQSALVSATVANVNRSRGVKAYSPADFIPEFGRQEPTQEEIIQKRIESFMGGRR